MSRTDARWMPLHIGAYLGDTGHLRTLEHGAYFLILMQYWTTGPLPDDDRKLAGLARMTAKEWEKHSATIREFFFKGIDGMLHQKRADLELAKAASISGKRATAARASHEQRGSKPDANAPAIAEQMHTHARAGYLNLNQDKESKSRGAPAAPALDLGDPKADKATRLPEDWKPDDAGILHCRVHGLDWMIVLPSFRDYWHAKPGKDGRKIDWAATWRNWCRNDRNARPPSANGSSHPITGTF